MIYVLGIITGLIVSVLIAVLHSMYRVSAPREINKIVNQIKKAIPSERGSFLESEDLGEKIKQIMKN